MYRDVPTALLCAPQPKDGDGGKDNKNMQKKVHFVPASSTMCAAGHLGTTRGYLGHTRVGIHQGTTRDHFGGSGAY